MSSLEKKFNYVCKEILIFFIIINLIIISYFRQVALSSAVSEKDAHLAWLEVIILKINIL